MPGVEQHEPRAGGGSADAVLERALEAQRDRIAVYVYAAGEEEVKGKAAAVATFVPSRLAR